MTYEELETFMEEMADLLYNKIHREVTIKDDPCTDTEEIVKAKLGIILKPYNPGFLAQGLYGQYTTDDGIDCIVVENYIPSTDWYPEGYWYTELGEKPSDWKGD